MNDIILAQLAVAGIVLIALSIWAYALYGERKK